MAIVSPQPREKMIAVSPRHRAERVAIIATQ